ncbi:DUF1643 domain-containing protein [Kocuria rosea]|uniref:DUF1643 domain-containing protein n=1 Tax=Kocuria rosea TaxID=1275 RepID=UPI00119FF9AF
MTGGRSKRELLCILANPPLGSGERTRARLERAREILGFEAVVIGNLFAIPSKNVTDISSLGRDAAGWTEARAALEPAIAVCDGALLAYGLAEPSGVARFHHRGQVDMVMQKLGDAGCPTFQVGDGPRHPSRWQRWTAKNYPELTFPTALRLAIAQI